MKTSELTGAALDWAVALIEYPEWKEQGYLEVFPHDLSFDDGTVYAPSTDWAQGGPIIEREGIHLTTYHQRWGAYAWPNHTGEPWPTDYEERVKRSKGKPASEMLCRFGPKPLIAAMRCYVASKLGDEVDIPEELTGVAA